MKRFNTLLIFFTLILGCKGQENKIEEKVSVNEQAQYETLVKKLRRMMRKNPKVWQQNIKKCRWLTHLR